MDLLYIQCFRKETTIVEYFSLLATLGDLSRLDDAICLVSNNCIGGVLRYRRVDAVGSVLHVGVPDVRRHR